MIARPSASTVPASALHEGPPITSARRWGYAALAVAPFLSVYLASGLVEAGATGFVQYDQPYYSANGREVFERGNGFTHPNPYDPSPDAPAIYFHWFTWLLGFGIHWLGADPGAQYVLFGVAGALSLSWITYRLIETLHPHRRNQTWLFFAAMWGGGLATLAALASNLVVGMSPAYNLFRLDPFGGWWSVSSWGRNAVFATEAVYHAIVAGTWLAALRQRWGWLLLGAALLASTHPFSGLQLLLMLLAWCAFLFVVRRSRAALGAGGALIVILGLFLGYYFVYLESFAAHRALRAVWTLEWTLPLTQLLLALALVGLAAAAALLHRKPGRPEVPFFGLCFAVSLLLVKHEWIFEAHQPLHFSRGYQWMPLFILGLPALGRGLDALRAGWRRPSRALLLALLMAVGVSDNAVFVLAQWVPPSYAVSLSPPEREMFTWMEREGLDGVLLCPYPTTSYLSATYTASRPYYGHLYNTPQFGERKAEVQRWFAGDPAFPARDPVDYVLLRRAHARRFYASPSWQWLHENEQWVLFGRR